MQHNGCRPLAYRVIPGEFIYVFFGVHPFGALQNKVYDAKDVTEIKVAKNIIEMEGERLDIVSDKPVSISKPTTQAP